MKKILYLLLLVVSFSSFGQKDGDGKSNWSNWTMDPCFRNLYISYKCNGYNKYSKTYFYNIKFKNTGSINIHFSFDSQFNTTGEKFMNGRFDVKAGGEYIWVGQSFDTPPSFNGRNDFVSGKVTAYLENQKDDWTLCMYSCDYNTNSKIGNSDCNPKGSNKTSSNSNQGNSNGNNTQSGNDNNSNSVDKTNNQIDRMNQYMEKIPDSDPEKTNINNEVNRITSNTNLTDSQRASQLNPLIDRAQRRASAIDSERNAKIEEGKRIQRENSAKIKKFDDTMKQGETALNNGKYDEAIGHFSQAYNIAPIDEARQMALQAIKTAKKAKEDAARRVRIAEKQQQEQATNDATTASLTAAVGLMVAMTDKISDGNFAAKFRFGVGIEQIPLVANVAKWKQVETATLLPTTFTFAFKTIFNNRGAFSIYAQPEIVLGLNAFQKGTSGGYISYGGMAGFQLGTSYKSKVKLFGEAGYFSRTGSYSYDLDVASGGTSATDRITEGEFKYNLLRFGGGIMFHFLNEDDDKEVIIKPAYYLEKLSFAPDSKPTGVFGFSISGLRLGQFDFMYSKNYAIGGKADYPAYWIIAAAPAYDKNYYQIRYTRQIRLK